jgi:hypothetical protein
MKSISFPNKPPVSSKYIKKQSFPSSSPSPSPFPFTQTDGPIHTLIRLYSTEEDLKRQKEELKKEERDDLKSLGKRDRGLKILVDVVFPVLFKNNIILTTVYHVDTFLYSALGTSHYYIVTENYIQKDVIAKVNKKLKKLSHVSPMSGCKKHDVYSLSYFSRLGFMQEFDFKTFESYRVNIESKYNQYYVNIRYQLLLASKKAIINKLIGDELYNKITGKFDTKYRKDIIKILTYWSIAAPKYFSFSKENITSPMKTWYIGDLEWCDSQDEKGIIAVVRFTYPLIYLDIEKLVIDEKETKFDIGEVFKTATVAKQSQFSVPTPQNISKERRKNA